MRFYDFLAALPLLTGCASIVKGTSQNILVNTNPPGADCGFYRQGLRTATVTSTPGSGLVNKTKNNIWIVCVKAGYQQATYFNHSGVAGGTFGNIVLGGGIGWAIDSASGADNKYDGPSTCRSRRHFPACRKRRCRQRSTATPPRRRRRTVLFPEVRRSIHTNSRKALGGPCLGRADL